MYFHWLLCDGRRGATLAHTEPWAQIRMGGRETKRGYRGGRKKKRKTYKKEGNRTKGEKSEPCMAEPEQSDSRFNKVAPLGVAF